MACSATELRRGVLLFILCSALAGCFVPARFSGYRPSGPGTLEGGYCVAGVKDRLRVHAPHGVDLSLQAEEDTGTGTILLDVELFVPDGISVQLRSRDLELQSPEWPETRKLAVDTITGGGARIQGPAAVLPGSSHESMGAYALWFMPVQKGLLNRTGVPAARRFSVTLPALDINGERYEPVTVAFETYREWGMYTCAQ